MLNALIKYNAQEYSVKLDLTSITFEAFIKTVKHTINYQEEEKKTIKILLLSASNRQFEVLDKNNFNQVINDRYEGNLVIFSVHQFDVVSESEQEKKDAIDFPDFDCDDSHNEQKEDKEETGNDLMDSGADINKNNNEKNLDDPLEGPKNDLENKNISNEDVGTEEKLIKEKDEDNQIKLDVKQDEKKENTEEKPHINSSENSEKLEINHQEKIALFQSAINVPSKQDIFKVTDKKEINEQEKENSEIPLSHPESFSVLSSENLSSIEKDEQIRNISYFCEFSNETCNICQCTLQGSKFVCCICDSCVICDICEVSHPHPTFKFKSHFLSTLKDTYYFIQKKQNIKETKKKFFDNILTASIELTIECQNDNTFAMRPKQTLKIPFTISNLSNKDISSKDFTIICKNFKHIKLYLVEETFTVKAKNMHTIFIICESRSLLCKEFPIVEIYSSTIKLKDCKNRTAVLDVEVNEDAEEEMLNKTFHGYEKIKTIRKKYKEMILYVMNEQISTKGPLEIYSILKDCQWNLDFAIDKLTAE